MLRYKTKTRPGLVALYDIRPGNGAGPFLQPRSPHGALELYHASGKLREKSSVLSSRLKAGRVVDEVTSTGRAFQSRATLTTKTGRPS